MVDYAVKVGKRTVALSNPDKVLYPAGKFTKADVVRYYSKISASLLPHFVNRPVTLVRYPDGVFGESFYEKNSPGFTPAWVKTFRVPRTEGGVINYILINDLPTLVWAANLAALELHPFLHRAPAIERPTSVVFDLDPGEGADLLKCAQVAFLLRELLSALDLECFPKVSGSKGLQIYVPLNGRADYDTTQGFARGAADLLARKHPDLVLTEMAKRLRVGKVFIDWSQNTQSKTTVGVYSLRAKSERPYVSLPITWEELSEAFSAKDPQRLFFSPDEAVDRAGRLGDLFAPVLKLKQKLPAKFTGSLAAAAPVPKPLQRYAAKRNFARTSEPTPRPAPELPRRSAQGSRRRFVVQKHAAQHLHFDFRLEMHDVLKSWAVPKGLPLEEGENHSAFETEDHPLDYLSFEGTIPKGQYGGGTVMVWDIGTYEVIEGNYFKGFFVVFLSGQKLKGEWTLNRMRGDPETNGKTVWLLKKSGGPARRISARKSEISSVSGRSVEEIARDRNSAVWQSNREGQRGENTPQQAPLVREHADKQVTARGRTRHATPGSSARTGSRRAGGARHRATVGVTFVQPMKPTLVRELPAGPQWIYEVKWDGYRALAAKEGDEVRLLSFKNNNLAEHFPQVVEAVRAVNAFTALMDGEIVAVNAQGQPSFQALQNRASLGREWHVVYYAFDLLNVEGEDLRRLPLEVRKARLQEVIKGSPVRFSAPLAGTPQRILQVVKKAGLEGVVAKRKDSPYVAAARSFTWQKLKLWLSQEFVIGGYNPDGSTFSSLLAGYYDKNRLLFAGKVRQGFTPAAREALMKAFKRLKAPRCPFVDLPLRKHGHFGEGITKEDMAKLQWLKPKLVAQVSFTEWTSYGLLRHATFLGLREDKEAAEVVREVVS